MYKRLHYIYALALFLSGAVLNKAAAQDSVLFPNIYLESDTLKKFKLDSVLVSSGLHRGTMPNRGFAVGTNVILASVESLSRMRSNSLADYIREQSSVYLKEYGRGMSAFISVRGTSSSHTTIAWNGMSMAVPTLGQADLSHIPLYFFDKMELHVGGSSVLYGDGSIGGTIQMNTTAKWERGLTGDLLLSAGSFSTLFTGATIRYSNGKNESRTSIFQSSAKNNYTFENNTKVGRPTERLNNSAYKNRGFLQEFHHKLKDSSLLSFNIWLLDFDREIQPSVSLNDRPESFASIMDRNLRSSLSYSGSRSKISYSGRLSFSHDYERYKEDIIAASRYMAYADIQYFNKGIVFKAGASAEYIDPDVDSYAQSTRESRGYLFLLTRYNPYQNLVISAGARAGGVTNSKVPFMPSLDVRYTPVRHSGHTLSLRGSLSKNSKVPSLNDRYWGGVHSYLRSEISFTQEGGADYTWFSGTSSAALFVTLYKSRVNDWIRWLPAGQVWRPQNIPQVLSRGGESGLTVTQILYEWSFKATLCYSYTDVKMVEALWREDPSVGQQLAYQPRHSWRGALNAERGNWASFVNISYTGERTTLDIYDTLAGYTLIDLGASYRGKILGKRVTVSTIIKNLLNVSYQNVKFYAMAPVNYQITLRWEF